MAIKGLGEVIAKRSRAPAELEAIGRAAMHRAVREVERDLKLNSLSARRPPPIVIRSGRSEIILQRGGEGGLAVNTDRFRASITAEVLPSVAGKTIGVVGTDIPWAHVHEYGATIVAKGRALAIPVMVQRAGTAARRLSQGKSASSGRRRGVMLVRSVTIPARRPFGQSADRMHAPVERLFADAVRQFVRVANG